MTKARSQTSSPVTRRQVLVAGTAAAAVATSGSRGAYAQAATTPSIPEVTVRHAVVSYTNHAWTVLAAKKGFLKEVGITMDGGAPKVLRDQQMVPQLQNGEVDITTMYFGLITQALDKVTNIKPILTYSYWQGNTILTSPKQGFKTVDDFLAQGMPWEKAAAAAMQQMKGQKFTITANPSTYPWNDFALGLGGMSMKDTQTVPIEDPKAVQLAISDQVPFAAPGGAVQIYQLQYQAGWKPVMSTRQMIKFVPGGPGSALNNLLNYDVLQCTQEYLDKNRNTVLRWCAAMYKTMDYMFGPQQVQAFTEYAPFINANTGAQMDPKSIKFIFEELDPFYQWKDQAPIWEDPNYALFYKNVYDFQIKKYIADGTLPKQTYDIDGLFQAKPIFLEMRELKAKSEALMKKLEGAGTVAPDRAELAKLGKGHYAGFNYLDSTRFLEAATA
jgi:ABC-type nitrate/sulfonate/bicarbonate transport system substrate-binding protein